MTFEICQSVSFVRKVQFLCLDLMSKLLQNKKLSDLCLWRILNLGGSMIFYFILQLNGLKFEIGS